MRKNSICAYSSSISPGTGVLSTELDWPLTSEIDKVRTRDDVTASSGAHQPPPCHWPKCTKSKSCPTIRQQGTSPG